MRVVSDALLNVAVTLVLVSTLAFALAELNPMDRSRALLEASGFEVVTEADEAALRRELGLDRPLPIQYALWVGNVLRGDLGISYQTRRPVAEMIATRAPPTFLMAGLAMLTSIVIAVPLGMLAALRHGRVTDTVIQFAAVAGASVPSFWLGYMLILLFSVHLGWLPAFGLRGPASLILPVVVLAVPLASILIRLVRSATLDAMSQDWVRTARSKGLSEGRILSRHAAPAIAQPVLAVSSVEFAGLLTGAAILEFVFAWPGLGRLVVEAVMVADTPVIAAFMLLSAFVFSGLNAVVTLVSRLMDRRL